MKLLYLLLSLTFLLVACDSTSIFLLRTGNGSSSGSTGTNEFSNLYIIHDTGEQSDYNITGFPGESYEVHIE